MERKKHEFFMKRAIALAKKAKGKTFPNPMVGALVVKNGSILSEGYHKKAGTLHAEIIALRKAGTRARGADLYVSLEPCAHFGRTAPCVDSIVKYGIKRVFAAMKDPNPLVNGKGFRVLRKKGIKVITGLCREEAGRINSRVYRNNRKNR